MVGEPESSCGVKHKIVRASEGPPFEVVVQPGDITRPQVHAFNPAAREIGRFVGVRGMVDRDPDPIDSRPEESTIVRNHGMLWIRQRKSVRTTTRRGDNRHQSIIDPDDPTTVDVDRQDRPIRQKGGTFRKTKAGGDDLKLQWFVNSRSHVAPSNFAKHTGVTTRRDMVGIVTIPSWPSQRTNDSGRRLHVAAAEKSSNGSLRATSRTNVCAQSPTDAARS
jgi:hypothetical protein